MTKENDTPPADLPPLPLLPEGVKAFRNIEYARVGGVHRLLLDLFLPDAPAPAPLIAWIHGGGWRRGTKDGCPAVYLAGEGFAVASIGYRLSDVEPFPAQIHDCKGAIRWLRAHADRYNLDANHIGAWGDSAGGHLVALLGTSSDDPDLEGAVGGNLKYSSDVQAVCNSCGVSDVFALAQAWLSTQYVPYMDSFLGGPIEKFKDKAVAASPLTYIDGSEPPFYSIHGEKDDIVPVEQSVRLDEALRNAGASSTLEIIPGGGHGMFLDPEHAARITDFFKRTLRG